MCALKVVAYLDSAVNKVFINMGKDKYTWLIPLWSHFPVPATKVVGPGIRKQVSL